MKNNQTGFTLIELMVVASIIVILMMIGAYTYNSARVVSRDNQRKSDLRTLSVALETFYSRNVYGRGGEYPLEDYALECDSSVESQCSGAITLTSWGATSDLQDLITQKILNKLPADPINKTVGGINYIYIYEPDKTTAISPNPPAGEGSPQCTGTVLNQTCRYVLQTFLEKDQCIYTIKSGYGQPNSMTLPSDCEGNVVPTGWATKPCCAQ